jgi:uncharacterized membrane protein YdjX (TVP38/TMEM64 family)
MAEDKNKKIIQKVVIACVIVLGIVAFRYFDLGQYFTLDYIKASQEKFQELYQAHRFQVIAAYMGIYIVVTALSLPGAAVPQILFRSTRRLAAAGRFAITGTRSSFCLLT